MQDDGPGLEPAQIEAVLQHGRRLVESTPDHSFGLPIATKLAGPYGGHLGLARYGLGSLQVALMLPS